MLVAGRRLDRRDDLARHAELGERAERRLPVDPKVANGLEESDQPFLNQVVRIAPGEKVRTRFKAHEAPVLVHDPVHRGAITVARAKHQRSILDLTGPDRLGSVVGAHRGRLDRSPAWHPRPFVNLRLYSSL